MLQINSMDIIFRRDTYASQYTVVDFSRHVMQIAGKFGKRQTAPSKNEVSRRGKTTLPFWLLLAYFITLTVFKYVVTNVWKTPLLEKEEAWMFLPNAKHVSRSLLK